MDKTAEQEWGSYAEEWANDNSQFTESDPERIAFLEGIFDFKVALKEEMLKEIELYEKNARVDSWIGRKCLDLIDQVKPKS